MKKREDEKMTDEVKQIVFNALHKGRLMRNAQKDYFKTRSQNALTASKIAEAEFDKALDDAAYAVKHNAPKPKQGELAI